MRISLPVNLSELRCSYHLDIAKHDLEYRSRGFWKDFGHGFVQGFTDTAKVAAPLVTAFLKRDDVELLRREIEAQYAADHFISIVYCILILCSSGLRATTRLKPSHGKKWAISSRAQAKLFKRLPRSYKPPHHISKVASESLPTPSTLALSTSKSKDFDCRMWEY